MNNQPLQPFHPPTILLQNVPGGVLSAGVLLEWFLYIVFAIWALYTLVAVYHWLRYSHGSLVAFPAIAAHLFVSLALMSYALAGTAPYFGHYLP